jgi:hypothetical protein
MALVLTITAAGRAALVNAQNTGTAPVTIAEVGVSPQAIAPTAATAALPGETKRIATLSGDVVAEDTIHLIVRDETSDLYTIRSFALYLADGTLFAAYGQANPIMEKSAQSLLLLAIDVRFVDIAAANLTFGNATFLNPPATVDRQGVIELATDAEATAGTDAVRAVTPKGVKGAVTAWLDARFGAGAPSAFIKGLLLSASAIAFRASLSIKSAALKDEGAGNGLDADLLDGQHGAWYADIPARLGYTPWHPSNDGAGSGLDADLLDGKEGAAYALLAGAPFTGTVTVGGTLGVTGAATFTARSTHEAGLTSRGGGGIQLNNAANTVGFSINNDGTSLTFSAPLAVTGAASASGNVSAQAGKAVLGLNGINPELKLDGGAGVTYAMVSMYSLGVLGYQIQSSSAAVFHSTNTHTFRNLAGNTNFAVLGTTGLDITGQVRASARVDAAGGLRATGHTFANGGNPAMAGKGVEIGITAAGVGYVSGYDRTAAAAFPLALDGSTVTVGGSGVFSSTGLAVTGLLQANVPAFAGGVNYTVPHFYIASSGTAVGNVARLALSSGTGLGMSYLDSELDADGASAHLLVRTRGAGGMSERARFNANGLAVTGALTRNGSTVWDAGNDGSGSGLDADLLDGQHGSYYLPAASYTAADVLTKLKTVDGAGTGLDADLLDGQHGAYYLPVASYTAADVLAKLKTVDGAGTGVDADLLDGQHGDFWRDWNNLLNKPASFPPSGHFHLAADLAGAFTGSMTQNGWVVLPNGLIIQWGRFSASPNTTTRVSFPMTFPSAGFAVSPNAGASGGADSSDNPPVLLGTTIDQVGFTVFSADDVTCNGAYIAIGY